MEKRFGKYLQRGLMAAVLTGSAIFGGCGSFWETDSIEKTAQRILERRETIEQIYREQSGIQIVEQPRKKEKPIITKNLDNTYTLFYECQFSEASNLEKLIKEQVKGGIVSLVGGNNQLIVKLSDESQISYLEQLINKSDKMPAQVLLNVNIHVEYADETEDFATQLDFSRGRSAEVISTITADYPGAALRVKGREDIGTKYGFGYEDDALTIKATLDVLKSSGYSDQIWETTLLLSNNKKGSLQEEEQLPIPNWIVAGQNVVQTYKLEPVKSFIEATPTIYENGLIRLVFKAGIGTSKRPEGPTQWLVPAKEEVESEGVYLKVGEPFIVAGKVNRLDLGIIREDPILPFLRAKDKEKRKSKIWYEITPFRVIYARENESLEQKDFSYNVEVLESKSVFDE